MRSDPPLRVSHLPLVLPSRHRLRDLVAGAFLCVLSSAAASAQNGFEPAGVIADAIDRVETLGQFFPDFSSQLDAVAADLQQALLDTAGQPRLLDSCRLRPSPVGTRSFTEARSALQGIEQILDGTAGDDGDSDDDSDSDDRPPVAQPPAGLVFALSEIEGDLLDVFQFLAEAAIEQARAVGGGEGDDDDGDSDSDSDSDGSVEAAERAFRRALQRRSAGRFVSAMTSLRDAWRSAQALLPDPPTSAGDPPILSIQSPADGARESRSPILVAGMVQDITAGTLNADDVRVVVDGLDAEVFNRSFQATGVALREGLNAVVAVATDTDGNRVISCIAVELDSRPRARISEISGNLQSAPILSDLPAPLVVRVSDAVGNPVPGAQVVFRVIQGNGSLGGGERGSVAISDGDGQASTAFTLGSRAGVGVNRVRATAVGFAGEAIFSAEANAGPAERINPVSGDNQRGGVGQALARPLVVVVTDGGDNPVAGQEVLFEVLAGGGSVGGSSSTTVATDSDGRASADFVLGPEEGLDNNLVAVEFPGLGNEAVTFKASGFTVGDPADTQITGVVLDGEGSPVPGVTLSVRQTTLTTVADAQGQFTLAGAPVGPVVLEVDASTTTRPGVWASLDIELDTLPGVDNSLEKPIYILPLDTASGRIVGGPEAVTVEVPEVPGFRLTVLPGSATFSDGSPTGLLTVTPVHADRIPMAPGSGMQPRFIVTVQPAGVRFDPPAPVSFPNVDGLPPGTVTEMFSFDHDLGEFVSIGTGTVSENGLTVASDPGFGIVKAGWHCAAPQADSGATATVTVEITNEEPVVLCPGGEGSSETMVIMATGDPPRDGEYTWESLDPSVFTLNPSGGGLCPNQPMCSTTATGVGPGLAEAKVTFVCTTTNAMDEDRIDVLVTEVEILQAEICPDMIQVRLSPEEATGTFTLRATGPEGDSDILQEERSGGTYMDNFNFAGLPSREFTAIEARWEVEGCIQSDTEEAHFKPLGNLRHTQYNCPSEADPTCAGGTTAACFANVACDYDGPEDLPATFVDQVTDALAGTGCGQTTGHGNIQIESFCQNTTNDEGELRFPLPDDCMGNPLFRENTVITPACGTNVGADTVAVDDGFLGGDLPCGSQICIRVGGGVVKTVTDRCPGCGMNSIDNFSNDGACGIGDFSGGAQTIKLF